MKLVTVVLFSIFLCSTVASYAQMVTLSEKNAKLDKVLQKIRRQTNIDFIFTENALKNAVPVNINIKNTPIKAALKLLFDTQPLIYELDDQSIVIRTKEKTLLDKVVSYFKGFNVQGTVVDEEGNPLVEATVSLLEEPSANSKLKSLIGTLTNTSGVFLLKDVKEEASIKVSYVGYEPYITKVKEELGTIQLKLSGNLQEVVVSTGYQTFARERSAGSFAKVDMGIIAGRTGTMNALQRMDGQIAGLVVNQAPGSNPLLIRGLNTINGVANPLVVVDGIAMEIGDINAINPSDIDNITVLKDATAASIWGTRAANGVIVITMKKGKHQSTKINYNFLSIFRASLSMIVLGY